MCFRCLQIQQTRQTKEYFCALQVWWNPPHFSPAANNVLNDLINITALDNLKRLARRLLETPQLIVFRRFYWCPNEGEFASDDGEVRC